MSSPLKHLLSRPDLSGCKARLLLQQRKFDINVVIPRALRSEAQSDLLVQFCFKEHDPLCEDLPSEEYV